MTNSVFRAYRYAADHPGLKGRDLAPKGTITERAAQGLDARPRRRPPGDRPQGKDEGKGGRRPGGGPGGGDRDDRPPRDDRSGPDNDEPQGPR